MDIEAILIAVVLTVGLLLLAVRFRAGSMGTKIGLFALCPAISVAISWAMISARPAVVREQEVANRPIEVAGDGYVSSDTCRACHPEQYATWHDSYHRKMTQVATPQSVIGDFENVELSWLGSKYRLEQRDGEFWVEVEEENAAGEDSPPVQKRIVMTTGSHHMQAYWYPTEQSRKLELFAFMFLNEGQQWVPRNAAFLTPPSLSPLSELGRWNVVCIRCHATHGTPRIEGPNRMDSMVSEFGISCEACHGPAEEHIRVNRDPRRRYELRLTDEPDRTIVNPARLPAAAAAQVCGQCHAINEFSSEQHFVRWQGSGFRYRPGDDLSRTMLTMQKRHWDSPLGQEVRQQDRHYVEDRFWSDGMVRISGRDYNGLIESPCYKHGDEEKGIMTCLSCHKMHKPPPWEDPRKPSEWTNDQLALGMEDNQACLQCHSDFEDDESLAAHTHHRPGSTGSRCYNCHMSYTTYGLLKAIRSHQVDTPSVDASLATGRPNACNQCHLDKTLAWAGEHLENWYGLSSPELNEEQQKIAASVLWTLRGDAGQRALMAWSMGWDAAQEASGTDWMAPYLSQLLVDPYDAVRFIAYRSLRRLPGYDRFQYDFMGSVPHRQAARQRAWEMWIRPDVAAGRAPADPILIGQGGKLRQSVFEGLLLQRDNRRFHMSE